MKIMSIYVLDRNGNEKMSAHHSKKNVDHFLISIVNNATIQPKYFIHESQHFYFKKNSENILLYICNKEMKTKGQVNLFFTKIKSAKNQHDLDELCHFTQFRFFQQNIIFSQHKLPPKNREMILR